MKKWNSCQILKKLCQKIFIVKNSHKQGLILYSFYLDETEKLYIYIFKWIYKKLFWENLKNGKECFIRDNNASTYLSRNSNKVIAEYESNFRKPLIKWEISIKNCILKVRIINIKISLKIF